MVQQQQPVSTVPPLPQPPLFLDDPAAPSDGNPGPADSDGDLCASSSAARRSGGTDADTGPAEATRRHTGPGTVDAARRGFPTAVALLVFAGSATALGSALYLFTRSRSR